MVNCENKINKLLLATEEGIFEKLIKPDHVFRKLNIDKKLKLLHTNPLPFRHALAFPPPPNFVPVKLARYL